MPKTRSDGSETGFGGPKVVFIEPKKLGKNSKGPILGAEKKL